MADLSLPFEYVHRADKMPWQQAADAIAAGDHKGLGDLFSELARQTENNQKQLEDYVKNLSGARQGGAYATLGFEGSAPSVDLPFNIELTNTPFAGFLFVIDVAGASSVTSIGVVLGAAWHFGIDGQDSFSFIVPIGASGGGTTAGTIVWQGTGTATVTLSVSIVQLSQGDIALS